MVLYKEKRGGWGTTHMIRRTGEAHVAPASEMCHSMAWGRLCCRLWDVGCAVPGTLLYHVLEGQMSQMMQPTPETADL